MSLFTLNHGYKTYDMDSPTIQTLSLSFGAVNQCHCYLKHLDVTQLGVVFYVWYKISHPSLDFGWPIKLTVGSERDGTMVLVKAIYKEILDVS